MKNNEEKLQYEIECARGIPIHPALAIPVMVLALVALVLVLLKKGGVL